MTSAAQTAHGAGDEAEHDEHRDDVGAKLGMWLFLFTEVMLFGGLFFLYAMYRFLHPQSFLEASLDMNLVLGAANTVILLTSSLTVVWAVTAVQKGEYEFAKINLGITLIFALAFMVNKYWEWSAEIHHGLYPGSEHLATLDQGTQLFIGLYFVMTGLHGLHVIIGASVLAWCYWLIEKGRVHKERFVFLENAGLYWHLVDIVWIFLFPLLYLIH